MQEANLNKDPKEFDNEIDFRSLFYILLEGKWIVISVTAFVSIIGVIYSLYLPNIYQSKAILVPTNPPSSISGASGSYNSLAGMAGIRIPPVSDEGNSVKALKKITTLSFFENSILPNIYLPNLIAIKSWNSETNTLIYDEKIYDTNSNTWIRDNSFSTQKIPSAQESFKKFKSDHFALSTDEDTYFTTLSIKHESPLIAKQWVELIVNEVNDFYRQKDKLATEAAASYLNKQISMTGLSEIKQVLAQLLQEETKKVTLIEANQFYVFDYIDPPVAMEQKSEPKRLLICIFSSLLGMVLSILLVLIRHYVFIEKTL